MPNPPVPPIVSDPAEVDAAWMTAALASSGLDVRVESVERTPVGTGQMAHNERFTIRYAGDSPGTPATIVGKFPSPDEQSRASGGSGAYRNEVRFYLDLAPRLGIRVPHCYYGAVSDDSSSFTLLLEDMAPAEQGDQIAGGSPAQIEAAIVQLAGLHGPLWRSSDLDGLDWIAGALGNQAGPIVKAVAPLYLERYADRLSSAVVEVTEAFASGIDRWLEEVPDSRTLVHGDYRLDNLLFGVDASGAAESTAVDWQTLSVGTAGRDLGFLLGTSFEPEERRKLEDRMLGAYQKALSGHGIDRSADELRADYRHGSFQGIYITMLGSMAVVRTDRGDAMFEAMAERSCALVRDLDAMAVIA